MDTTMTDTALLIEIDPRGVAEVTINRPEVLNAFDENLIERISAAFERLNADPAVRIVVLRATGRVSCAGADIGWMQRAAANPFDDNLEDARRFATMMATVARCRKPVIARVQGAAYGGGVGLACAADIVIASKHARFCVSEAKLGILPAVIGPYLVNAVGVRQAQRLSLTCTVFDAAEALALGLAHQVVQEAELDAAVQRCAGELLLAGPLAQGSIKRLFGQLQVGPVTGEIQELTAQTISRVRSGAEARAGLEAFVAKRPPPWVVAD
jgi:methylglutaconyl-CoA hydratase